MKARVHEYVNYHFDTPGEYIVRLEKLEFFEDGRLNKAGTLRNGFVVLETIREAYGWGLYTSLIDENIVDYWIEDYWEEEDE